MVNCTNCELYREDNVCLLFQVRLEKQAQVDMCQYDEATNKEEE